MKINDTLNKYLNPISGSFIIFVVIFFIYHNPARSGETGPGGRVEIAPAVSAPPISSYGQGANENNKNASKMIIYVDPQTGEIVEQPTAVPEKQGVEDPQLRSNAPDASDEDFVEIPSPDPEGGVMVHLKDRFLRPLIITRHPDDQLTIQHLQESPVSDQSEQMIEGQNGRQ
jgi:hypothetical protein